MFQNVSLYMNHHQGALKPVLRQSYNVDIGYIYLYFKLSVLWLKSAQSTRITELNKICSHSTDNFRYDICNRYQHCNFGEAQARAP